MTTLLEAALEYAQDGIPVFPCNKQKRPLTDHGFYDATTDVEKVKAWWKKWPDAFIGMPTGEKTGAAILDLDVKKGKDGFKHVPNWESRTPVIGRTGSGGAHLYFKAEGAPPCTSDDIALGVDTRGNGGYVILPPSPGYTWTNGRDFSALPPWPDDMRPKREERTRTTASGEPQAVNLDELAAAVRLIPNDDLGWDDWNNIGMAIWRATGGSDAGLTMFDSWSKKSDKHDPAETEDRWAHYSTSPPKEIGAGTLFLKATEADPHWREKFRAGIANKLILTNAEFVSEFVPPDYLIDGLLQRGFLYSFTALTGSGKTVFMLLVSMLVLKGWPLGDRSVEKGKVLFFAGENPDDVRMRWIKLCDDMGVSDLSGMHWVEGVVDISKIQKTIDAETKKHGPFALIVIDTGPAYFLGDDENSNAQLGAYARMLRKTLTSVYGRPVVVVTGHPTKNAGPESMLPRGGSAYLGEVDGNLSAVVKSEVPKIVEVHWQGKFRGTDFAPIPFKIEPGTTEKLKDSKGRLIWTVIATLPKPEEVAAAEAAGVKRQHELIRDMQSHEGSSMDERARRLSWFYSNGDPNKTLVKRTMDALERLKLAEKIDGTWVLTKAGKAKKVPEERF